MKRFLLLSALILLLAVNLRAADDNDRVRVEVLAKTSSSWDGSRLPAYPQGEPEITILKITIAPGVKLPLHKHPVINAGFMLKGQLTVITADNRKLHLKAGDSIVEVVNKWHYGVNEGSQPAEIVVFYAGVRDMPITVKK